MGRSRELAELASAYDGSSLGFRNRIINGDMRIDQRNAGAAVTSSTADDAFYVIDRWYGRQNVASKFSVQRSTVAPDGFSNSSLLTSLSSYSIGSSEHFATTQAIEGNNIQSFAWGTASGVSVTLSFWVRSSLTGTFGGHVNNHDSTMTYVFSYTINAANTWEQKTITIPAPSTSTWQTDNTVGLYLTFSIGAGSSLTRSVGWGSFARSVTGQTSLVGTNGATFYITGVQLEAGSVATPFQRRDYGRELMMCQRYCVVVGRADIYNPVGYGYAINTTKVQAPVILPVEMRITPSSISVNGNWQASDGATATAFTSVVVVGGQNSPKIITLEATVASGLTQFRPYRIEAANSSSSYIVIPAEL